MIVRPWLVLGALVAVAAAASLAGGHTFADLGWLGQVAPARAAAGHAVASGQVPGWWPDAGFGAPLLGELRHGALYPPTWLAAADLRLLDMVAWLHVWLLALGVAALARRQGADPAGELLAGACAALAGITVGALVAGDLFALAWSPWAAAAAIDLSRRTSSRPAAWLCGSVAACALAGAPAILLATIAGAVIAGGVHRRFGAGLAAAAALGGLALAAVQLAPALLHVVAGHAAGGRDPSPGLRLIELAAPGATPPPAAGVASFAGGAALLAIAALSRSRWLVVPGLLIAAAIAAALTAGAPGPLAGTSAALVVAAWPWLCAIAGTGLARVTAAPPDRNALVAAAAVIAAPALALAIAAVMRYPIAHALDRRGLDGAAVVEHGLARGALAVGFAGAAIAAALVAARRRDVTLVAAAGVLVVAQVAIGGRGAVARIPRPGDAPALFAHTGGRVLRNLAGPPRTHDAPRGRADEVARGLARGAAQSAADWGVAAVPSTDPARLAVEDRLPAVTAAVAARVIDRYAVPHAVVPASITDAAGMKVVVSHGDESLIATAPRRPPGFWVERWRHASDDDALHALAPPPGERVEPLGSVILAGAGGDAPIRGGESPAPHACAITRDGDAAVELRCDVTAPGYAVVLDAWAPGWNATVDGHDADVVRADLIVRAVRVAPGAHAIRFEYTPPGWWLGVAITMVAASCLILLLAIARRRGYG